MREQNQLINIDELISDYKLNWDLFSDTDERLRKFDELNNSDKIVIVLYAEYKSYREVGRILRLSHTTIMNIIKNIRKEFEYDT